MDKSCIPRGGDYTVAQLIGLAMERLGWTRTAANRATKKQLCEALGIAWREKEQTVIHPEKVCTDRRTKAYPNRYSKEELIAMIRRINPYMNKGRLSRATYKTLCNLARIPFLPREEKEKNKDAIIRAEPSRFFQKIKTKTDEIGCLERGAKRVFAYQRRVIEHFRAHRGLIAVHSLGSGKTLTAVYASQCYLDEFPTHKVVVVSPASLIENFKKEMREFGDLRHPDRYEFFSFQGFYQKYKDQPRDCRRQFLIVDEAHNLRTEHRKTKKRESGKITRTITQCAERADRILLLTATPIINRPVDIAPLLSMVRDHPTIENRILAKDVKKNLDNADYFRAFAGDRFSFYERERTNADYPRSAIHDIYLPMPTKFLHLYENVENDVGEDDAILRIFGESKLKPFFNGIRRAVNILSELPEAELVKSPKVRWILEQIREAPHLKTVIFSHFLDMGLEAIISRLPAGVRSAYITGRQTKKQRSEIVQRYNRNELDILFISKAGGEGLDLKGTRRVILLESGWNENSEKQVIGRAIRYRSHTDLPPDEQLVDVYRLHHVKPDEQRRIDEFLSPDYHVVYNDPSTWLSADLMLKKISKTKQDRIDAFLRFLHQFSIEAVAH